VPDDVRLLAKDVDKDMLAVAIAPGARESDNSKSHSGSSSATNSGLVKGAEWDDAQPNQIGLAAPLGAFLVVGHQGLHKLQFTLIRHKLADDPRPLTVSINAIGVIVPILL
jgi:hypothetical protein